MTSDNVQIGHKLNYYMYTYSCYNFEVPQCFWHLIEFIYSSHSLLITIQLILMLQIKILWKKYAIYDSVSDRWCDDYSPKVQLCDKINCYSKYIWCFTSHSAWLHKNEYGKTVQYWIYISCLPLLKMDLNIQWCGSLPWIWEDKESLINGTSGVKILLCDGKHMEFLTVQPKNWQRCLMSTASSSLPLFPQICQLERTGCAVFPLSPKQWNWLCC